MKTMTRILSLDWDYFVNTDADTRAFHFPDGGNENLPENVLDLCWSIRYADNPSIEEIGVRKKDIQHILKVVEGGKGQFTLFTSESHKTLGEYILPLAKDFARSQKGLEIVNVDFHSDLYNKGEEVNCGNWANKILESIEGARLTWISREDSSSDELTVLPYRDRVTVTSDITSVKGSFDIIWLFRSGCWSPPHLDREFSRFAEKLSKDAHLLFCDTLKDRWVGIKEGAGEYEKQKREFMETLKQSAQETM